MKTITMVVIAFSLFFALSAPAHASAVMTADNVATTSDDGGFTFSSILNFIKDIFVPADDYFNDQIAKLNNNVNKKLGGVAYLYKMVESFFNTLQTAPTSEFNVSVPDGFFGSGYDGIDVDLFEMAKPFINLLRAVFTAFICIGTAIICYRKIIKIFEK